MLVWELRLGSQQCQKVPIYLLSWDTMLAGRAERLRFCHHEAEKSQTVVHRMRAFESVGPLTCFLFCSQWNHSLPIEGRYLAAPSFKSNKNEVVRSPPGFRVLANTGVSFCKHTKSCDSEVKDWFISWLQSPDLGWAYGNDYTCVMKSRRYSCWLHCTRRATDSCKLAMYS